MAKRTENLNPSEADNGINNTDPTALNPTASPDAGEGNGDQNLDRSQDDDNNINPDPNAASSSDPTDEGKDDKKPKKPVKKDSLPVHIEEALKKRSQYEALYIDALGGIYIEGTPEHLRKNATLYKNPFYTPQ